MKTKYDYEMISEKMDELIKMAQEVKEECTSASPKDWNISEKIVVEIPNLLDDIWNSITSDSSIVNNFKCGESSEANSINNTPQRLPKSNDII